MSDDREDSSFPERRREIKLSAEQIDAIVEGVVEQIISKHVPAIAKESAGLTQQWIYQEVGKSTIKLILWVLGSAVLTLLAYLGTTKGLK